VGRISPVRTPADPLLSVWRRASIHAPAEAEDRLVQTLLAVLTDSGYIKPPVDASQTLKLRRLIRRMGLSERDALMWQGMMRQISWKMKQ
jgi:tRNA C32,U32 (ribose-2'-O)-methylase TrmJ